MTLGLLLVDHGSRRDASNVQLADMAERVAMLRPDALVAYAHMEIASPSIGDAFLGLVNDGADDIRVLLYFLSDGRHVREDIPALVADAAKDHPSVRWSIGLALGPHDGLARLLLERADVPPPAITVTGPHTGFYHRQKTRAK